MTLLGFALAAALYLLSAAAGFRTRAIGRGGVVVVGDDGADPDGAQASAAASPRPIALLMGAGVLVHGLGLWGLHVEEPPIPLESFPAALSVIGLLVAFGFLVSMAAARVGTAGGWVALVAALFTLSAEVGLQLSVSAERATGGTLWSHAHVLLSAGGFSLLSLASLSGLGYLAKERSLRHPGEGRAIVLPSLESLDRAGSVTLSAGFALLTLGVITGFAWGIAAGATPWTGHAVLLLISWFVYLIPVGLRLVGREHGALPARGVVMSFALLLVSYIGVRVFGTVA